MKLARDGRWLIRRRGADTTRAIGAACALVLASFFVGGPLGWASALFFAGLMALLLRVLIYRPAIAMLDPGGITLSQTLSDRGLAHRHWREVEALVLWTLAPAGEEPLDILTLIRGEDETFADVDSPGQSIVQTRRRAGVLDESLELTGCVVDTHELRAVIVGLGSAAQVVDRRVEH